MAGIYTCESGGEVHCSQGDTPRKSKISLNRFQGSFFLSQEYLKKGKNCQEPGVIQLIIIEF